jgi:hypothetical protein
MSNNRITLPSKAELETLPTWARVAFASRCGRRVQEIFEYWAGANEPYRKAGDKALRMAESAADKGACPAYNTAEMTPIVAAARKSRSGYYAAKAILDAAEAATDLTSIEPVVQAAYDSVKAIRDDTLEVTEDYRAAREAEDQAKQQTRDDFEFLARQAQERKWNMDSKVPWTLFSIKSIWPKAKSPE